MINRKTFIRITKKYTMHQNVVCSYEVGATPHTNTEREPPWIWSALLLILLTFT